MLYSHDALGLGHVRRMLAIARAVLERRDDASTLLVTCSPQVDHLPIPQGLDYLKLPSARKSGPGDYRPRTLRLESERFRALRSALVDQAARTFAPQLLLVDKSPLGLMGELARTLEVLRDQAGARLVLGWRDILDASSTMHAEWDRDGTLEMLEHTYDEIWVYGDSSVFDVREAYRLPDAIAERVHHLGYLAPRVPDAERRRVRESFGDVEAPLALVTVGGGEEGERLVLAYLRALREHRLPDGLRTLVVTGPFMSDAARREVESLAGPDAHITPFVPGLEAHVAAADVVIGRAGYNTVCEVLGAATPSVLVPRQLHRDEQVIRARRLSDLGLTELVDEPSLSPPTLARAVRRALARGRVPAHRVQLNGLERTAGRVDALLPRETWSAA